MTIRAHGWIWWGGALVAIIAVMGGVLLANTLQANAHADDEVCAASNFHCLTEKLALGEKSIRSLPLIKITPVPDSKQVIMYSVQTKGAVTADMAEFKAQANQTLNDSRGWAKMGIKFKEVASGGQFTLVLAQASQVPTFSSGCDSTYSCNVGNFVIINQDRWLGATPSWNAGGGSLRDYRHMVINHETGHWLGHGHAHCAKPGTPAAVMQQQSINLQGCTFNPWPLSSELYSPRLGL